jgi:hypothetical protein
VPVCVSELRLQKEPQTFSSIGGVYVGQPWLRINGLMA